jgi:hypothetical protein
MSFYKIITHPVTLIISFLYILISGEHVGGLYIWYLLMAAPYGIGRVWWAFAGILSLLISRTQPVEKRKVLRSCLRITGSLELAISLFVFFRVEDKNCYNCSTFEQTIPLITLILFGVLGILVIIRSARELVR